MDQQFQQQLIQTVQQQTKLINDMTNQINCMDLKINYIKQELDTVHWNITHVFGVINEVKKLVMDKMDLS